MPSNVSAPWVHYWAGHRPGSVAHLYSPGGQRGPYPWLPYALDNGAFNGFDETKWDILLRWACIARKRPLWAAVPDALGDPDETNRRWEKYLSRVTSIGLVPAFVVQDGHQAEDVPKEAEVLFVGGSTEWKRETAEYWCKHFPRVHVGRVNTYKWLRYYYKMGCESCDGTGYNRGDQNQLDGLFRFLEEINE